MNYKPIDFLDERLGTAKFTRKSLNKIFPDHWSFMLGEIAMYSFFILLGTGVFLTLFFVPSSATTVYNGSYAPMDGHVVSQAYASTLNLSFNVRAGLVMRQMHHWAANVFVAAIVVHLLRVFFTGAFRKPREINWLVGSLLLMMAILEGFLGYSLPDDLISGTGIRIAYSITLSIPVVGSYLASFLFGGQFPGDKIIPRFYTIHILLIPALMAGLLGAHLAIMWHQKHTQYKGKGRTEKNVVGIAMWPAYAMQAGGFFFLTAAVLAALGGLVQINPIWMYGPYIPYKVSYAVQPDWYMGWLDGALRLFPSWEITGFGHMIPTIFFPAVLLPGITFGLLMAWPWIERKFTKDSAVHHLLENPRDNPWRTSVGVGVMAFYMVLFFASSTDVLANTFNVSLNFVLWTFRVLVFVIPPIAAFVAYQLAKEARSTPLAGTPRKAMVVFRSEEGEYTAEESDPRSELELKRSAMHGAEPKVLPEEARIHGETEPEETAEEEKFVFSVSSVSAVVTEEIGERPSGGSGVYQVPRGAPGAGGGLFSPRGPQSGRDGMDSEDGE